MNSLIRQIFSKGSSKPHSNSMVIWLDPEKFIVGDTLDKISVLLDQSGNGHDISQNNGTNQPFNDNYIDGKRFVDFRGGQYLQSQADFTTPHEIIGTHFVVVNNRFNAQRYIIDGITGTGRNIISFAPTQRLQIWAGSGWNPTADNVYALNDTIVISVVFNAGSSNFYLDGVEIPISNNAMPYNFAGMTLGARYNGVSAVDTSVGDYLYYNKRLTPQEINETGKYLAKKYGTSYTDVL